MREDDFTNTPEDAAAYEALRGRAEWIDDRPTRAELEADDFDEGGEEDEAWLPVVGAPGYEVSDQGRVRSWRPWQGRPVPRILQQTLQTRGRELSPYQVVTLSIAGRQKSFRVHRLVAEAFIGPRPADLETRHLDGNSLNNTPGNLAYGTHSENTFDRVAHGTHNVSSRTHCPQGHPYDEANTYYWPKGSNRRICRACRRVAQAKKNARRKPCPQCGKHIGSSNLSRHIRDVHPDPWGDPPITPRERLTVTTDPPF